MHGGTRWDSKRIRPASGRLWPWYRSHGVTKLSLVTPRGPSIIRTDAHIECRRPACFGQSQRTSLAEQEDLCECIHGSWRQTMRQVPLCGQCTRYGREPRAENKYSAQGQDLWRGRDQFDVCAYDLAEISSTSALTAWPRSVRRVRPRLVGVRPAVLMSIDCAEQLPAPLLIVFQMCMYFIPRLILVRLFRASILLHSPVFSTL